MWSLRAVSGTIDTAMPYSGYRLKLPEINCSNRICEKRPYSVSFSKRFNTVDRQADFEQYLGLAVSRCLSGARLTIARENK